MQHYVCYPDIDECSEQTHDCDADAECTNTEGSFQCKCPRTFCNTGTARQGECIRIGKTWTYIPRNFRVHAAFVVYISLNYPSMQMRIFLFVVFFSSFSIMFFSVTKPMNKTS